MKVLKWGGVFLSIVSITVLIWRAFHLGLAEPFALAFKWWESLTQLALGPFEPYLRSLLQRVNSVFNLHLHLYSHWKHVFILMWLYFGTRARSVWRISDAIFSIVWGGLIALISSLAAGAIPIDTNSHDLGSQVLIVAIPVTGWVLFEISDAFFQAAGKTPDRGFSARWSYFTYLARGRVRTAILGFIAIVAMAALLHFYSAKQVQSPGVLLLGVLVALLAIQLIVSSFFGTLRFFKRASPGERAKYDPPLTFLQFIGWRKREGFEVFFPLSDGEDYKQGVLMLTIMFGALFFIAANAGLQLVGL